MADTPRRQSEATSLSKSAQLGMCELLTKYQVPGMADICPTCRRWADKQKSDLLSAIGPQMREAITARKGGRKPSTLAQQILKLRIPE